ncbi:pheromone A receptor-domain-containing protein [Mycena metata]|uniref:Pheromone A receptor-domain-containing protein n=1 Tax=Mycena metata TaxID=1033252 RepID=A0AAD7JAN3_9AGAR|nr:pheromone A receptor-domain-containing protein [Mycena metata]
MSDALYPLFSVFTFLGFVLVLIPLPWHFRTWNSGTCFYIMWSALVCLNQFVNSVVWANDSINRAPAWCDISIRITLAASVGIPAASLCINRRLYQIARAKPDTITAAQKRRAVLADSLVCILFPLVYVALQYIVQSRRFDIYEQVGCFPVLSNTIPVYFLSMIWPPLIALVSAVYSILSLYAFRASRAAFNEFLDPTTTTLPALTVSRYLRLMVLAATAILVITPFSIVALWMTLTATPITTWHSLSATHLNFSRIDTIPASVWRASRPLAVALELTRWSAPLSALSFFALFGLAPEARQHYARLITVLAAAFWRLMGLLGFQRPALGVFAAPFVTKRSASQSSSSTTLGPGIGYTKPAPSFEKDVKSTLSHFSAVSRVPTSRFSAYSDNASVSVSSAYPADSGTDVDVHTPASAASFVPVQTPASATSFGSSVASTPFAYALPLHIGWQGHGEAYPASPTSYRPASATSTSYGEEYPEDEEEGCSSRSWSPVSDARSLDMEDVEAPPMHHQQPQRQDTAARGRALA